MGKTFFLYARQNSAIDKTREVFLERYKEGSPPFLVEICGFALSMNTDDTAMFTVKGGRKTGSDGKADEILEPELPDSDFMNYPPLQMIFYPIVKGDSSNVFSTMITLGRAGNNDIKLVNRYLSKFAGYFKMQDGSCIYVPERTLNPSAVLRPRVVGDSMEYPSEPEILKPREGLVLEDRMMLVLGGIVNGTRLIYGTGSPGEFYDLVMDIFPNAPGPRATRKKEGSFDSSDDPFWGRAFDSKK